METLYLSLYPYSTKEHTKSGEFNFCAIEPVKICNFKNRLSLFTKVVSRCCKLCVSTSRMTRKYDLKNHVYNVSIMNCFHDCRKTYVIFVP